MSQELIRAILQTEHQQFTITFLRRYEAHHMAWPWEGYEEHVMVYPWERYEEHIIVWESLELILVSQ